MFSKLQGAGITGSLFFVLTLAAAAQTPADIAAGHLASIGTTEARAKVKNRQAAGSATMKIIVGGKGTVVGRSYIFSEPPKFRVALPFDFNDYWGENFSAENGKVVVGFSQPSSRTPFGGFLDRYSAPLQEGLVGGVLSMAWPFLDLDARQPKLDLTGRKKIDGKDCYVIVYHMKKGQDVELNITLYFEAETFHHVRSLYEVTTQSGIGGGMNNSSKAQEGHYIIEEVFSDFKTIDGITLPTHWLIRSDVTRNRAQVREWQVVLDKIVHNEPIDARNFVVDLNAK